MMKQSKHWLTGLLMTAMMLSSNGLCITQRSNRQQSVSRFQQLSDSSFASAGPKEARGCQNQ
jgi:hypothetical protein